MKTVRTIASGLVALLIATACPLRASALDFSQTELERLKAGKAVRKPLAKAGDKGFYGGSGFALIDAPPEQVWEAILDFGSYARVYPKTVDVREVSRKGDRSLVRMQLGHELISVSYFVEVTANRSRWQLDYKLVTDRPHDIEEAYGYWRLFPQSDGRTLAAYVVAVRVPMGLVNLIPQSMERKINRTLLGSPRYLRDWVVGERPSHERR
jgi:ribosome-associated toxin RatA of RatAB toxin-antitoxin module